ncbi:MULTISPECIES: YxeA family protein [Lactobacillales]|uniref:YxeA family protein n=1 Tax=Lactobacillales TaxID=186826 RepID=UPI001F063215|nr:MULTISPECIES: YxeA family protein [Lactobacillales]MCH1724223.1 YxeA family protein [Lactococcus formosensis]WKY25474.1 YxeA family protein [Lactococcus sp. bn62]MCH1736884.1 YxeA family protein [Enterococcus faecalis]MCT9928191.1 YxeA family protein [Enterococcus faecalis]MCV5984522.1 YxeA family protein [Enterococcus faecalis]
MDDIKEFVISIGTLIAVIVIGFFGSKIYNENNPGELGAVVDQLNPFISQSEVYVKTKSYDDINKDDMYSYTQTAADKTGKTRKIIFTSSKELKKGHYLKLSNKGTHINSYEEVQKEQVPEKALKTIDNK